MKEKAKSKARITERLWKVNWQSRKVRKVGGLSGRCLPAPVRSFISVLARALTHARRYSHSTLS